MGPCICLESGCCALSTDVCDHLAVCVEDFTLGHAIYEEESPAPSCVGCPGLEEDSIVAAGSLDPDFQREIALVSVIVSALDIGSDCEAVGMWELDVPVQSREIKGAAGGISCVVEFPVGVLDLIPSDACQRSVVGLSEDDGHRVQRAGAECDLDLVGDSVVIRIDVERVGAVVHLLAVGEAVAVGVHVPVQGLAVSRQGVRILWICALAAEQVFVVVGEPVVIEVGGLVGSRQVSEVGVFPPVCDAVAVGVTVLVLLGVGDGEECILG